MNRFSNQALSTATLGLLGALAIAGCESGPTPAGVPAPTKPAPAAGPAQAVRVEVGPHGFQPSRVLLGTDRRLVFRRTSDETCATAVVFPSIGLQRQLPLGADVAVDLPSSVHGELGFQCSMGMYKSKVVVQ